MAPHLVQLNYVIAMLKSQDVCIPCKQLIVYDVCCFFMQLSGTVCDARATRTIPQFKHGFSTPLLRACKACGRGTMLNLCAANAGDMYADALFDFMRSLMAVEYGRLLQSKEVHSALSYCYEVCGSELQSNVRTSRDCAVQTNTESDDICKVALKKIAKTMNMYYMIPELVVEQIRTEFSGNGYRVPESSERYRASEQKRLEESSYYYAKQFAALASPPRQAKRPTRVLGTQTAAGFVSGPLNSKIRAQISVLCLQLAEARAGKQISVHKAQYSDVYLEYLQMLLYTGAIGAIYLERLFARMETRVLNGSFIAKFFPGAGPACISYIRRQLSPVTQAYVVEAVGDFDIEFALSQTKTKFQFDFSEQEKLVLALAVLTIHGYTFDGSARAFVIRYGFPTGIVLADGDAQKPDQITETEVGEDFD